MVVRIGIVGEDLKTAISIHSLQVGAGGTIGSSAFGNSEWRAVIRGDRYWVGSSREPSLNVGAGLAEMDGVASNVAEFDNPLFTEITLNREIPLLGVGNDEMARDRENK